MTTTKQTTRTAKPAAPPPTARQPVLAVIEKKLNAFGSRYDLTVDGQVAGYATVEFSEDGGTILDALFAEKYRGKGYYKTLVYAIVRKNPGKKIFSAFRSPEAERAWVSILKHLPADLYGDTSTESGEVMHTLSTAAIRRAKKAAVPPKAVAVAGRVPATAGVARPATTTKRTARRPDEQNIAAYKAGIIENLPVVFSFKQKAAAKQEAARAIREFAFKLRQWGWSEKEIDAFLGAGRNASDLQYLKKQMDAAPK